MGDARGDVVGTEVTLYGIDPSRAVAVVGYDGYGRLSSDRLTWNALDGCKCAHCVGARSARGKTDYERARASMLPLYTSSQRFLTTASDNTCAPPSMQRVLTEDEYQSLYRDAALYRAAQQEVAGLKSSRDGWVQCHEAEARQNQEHRDEIFALRAVIGRLEAELAAARTPAPPTPATHPTPVRPRGVFGDRAIGNVRLV